LYFDFSSDLGVYGIYVTEVVGVFRLAVLPMIRGYLWTCKKQF
jgi:hypothetical protein